MGLLDLQYSGIRRLCHLFALLSLRRFIPCTHLQLSRVIPAKAGTHGYAGNNQL